MLSISLLHYLSNTDNCVGWMTIKFLWKCKCIFLQENHVTLKGFHWDWGDSSRSVFTLLRAASVWGKESFPTSIYLSIWCSVKWPIVMIFECVQSDFPRWIWAQICWRLIMLSGELPPSPLCLSVTKAFLAHRMCLEPDTPHKALIYTIIRYNTNWSEWAMWTYLTFDLIDVGWHHIIV